MGFQGGVVFSVGEGSQVGVGSHVGVGIGSQVGVGIGFQVGVRHPRRNENSSALLHIEGWASCNDKQVWSHHGTVTKSDRSRSTVNSS